MLIREILGFLINRLGCRWMPVRARVGWLLMCIGGLLGGVALANTASDALYQALDRGDLAAAEAGFQRLVEGEDREGQSQGWAGLAAVAAGTASAPPGRRTVRMS